MSRTIAAYSFGDLAGCVEQRISRQTGVKVGLYHAGLDACSGPWATICEEHGQIVNHATLRLARSHLADPLGWCEHCRQHLGERATDTELHNSIHQQG